MGKPAWQDSRRAAIGLDRPDRLDGRARRRYRRKVQQRRQEAINERTAEASRAQQGTAGHSTAKACRKLVGRWKE